LTKEVSSFFNNFATEYDKAAFKQSLGTQYLSEIETNFVLKNLRTANKSKILEIGIGTGRFAQLLGSRTTYYGIDISCKMMEGVKKKLKIRQVNLILADGGKTLPLRNNRLDGVICIRVLKYIPTWKQTIKETSRVLQKNGIFICEVANSSSVAHLGLKNAKYRLLNPDKVIEILRNTGFKINKIEPSVRLPFPLYTRIKNPKILNFFKKVERTLNILLPKKTLSRNILIASTKGVS